RQPAKGARSWCQGLLRPGQLRLPLPGPALRACLLEYGLLYVGEHPRALAAGAVARPRARVGFRLAAVASLLPPDLLPPAGHVVGHHRRALPPRLRSALRPAEPIPGGPRPVRRLAA